MGKQTRRKIGLRSALFPNVWSNDVDDANVVRAQVTRLKDALPAGRQASPSSSPNRAARRPLAKDFHPLSHHHSPERGVLLCPPYRLELSHRLRSHLIHENYS